MIKESEVYSPVIESSKMSREDSYRGFLRQPSRDSLSNVNEDEPSSKTTLRQQRHSVIRAEKTQDSDFTQTPFGNDDMFNSCFDDCDEESMDPFAKFEQKLSQSRANSSNVWTSNRKLSWHPMPTANGKIVDRRETIETGFSNEFDSEFEGIHPRRHSEYFIDQSRLTRSYQTDLHSRYQIYQRQQQKTYEKWSYKYDTGFTNLSSIYPTRKMPQSYDQIKQSCLRSGRLYEDPEFDAIDDNVFTSRRPPRPFVWRRPTEMVQNPILVDAGASRMDVAQGRLGDCWFLAGIASLTQHEQLFKRVCPTDDQSFDKRDYCGAFHFRFWQGGEWVDVIIDDRLPTINNQLIFVHSKSRNEFWSALMEKAYAKLCGSYEALKGGQTSEAMEDFTGGMTESFDLGSKAPQNLFNIMSKAIQRQSLMGCSINAKSNQIEAKLDNGLVMGHAYTVTGVRKVNARTRSGKMEVELVRVRNPWGNEREWTGAWGDKSSEWSLLSEQEKREMELTFEDDGEFWMSYRDFISNFQRLEICMLSPDASIEDSKVTWEADIHKDRWRVGSTAGGCRNNPNTFHKNPQFRVTLQDVDEDDDDDACTLIVSLMQVGRRKLRRKLGANSNLTIGFAIYKLEEEDMKAPRLGKDYFLYHASTARSNTFINAREITNRFKLKPGIYCIVPSTFDANEEGDFLVRLFSEKEKKSDVQDEQTRMTRNVKPRITASEDASLDSKYKSFFDRVAGQDGQVDAYELKQVLGAAFGKDIGDQDFNIETCRSLISMYDDNGTGKLEYDEFKQTLVTTKQCHAEFKKYDKDRSGTLDMYELQDVLEALGIKMSTRCLTAITCRYANKKGTIDFDDFLQIYTRVVGLIETFNKHCRRGSSQASFGLDDFIEGAVGL